MSVSLKSHTALPGSVTGIDRMAASQRDVAQPSFIDSGQVAALTIVTDVMAQESPFRARV